MKCFLISHCILACVIARQGRRVLILLALRLRHQERARCCTPVLRKQRQADFLTPAPAGSPRTRRNPDRKLRLHRAPLGEILGQHAPLANASEQVQHCAERLIQLH